MSNSRFHRRSLLTLCTLAVLAAAAGMPAMAQDAGAEGQPRVRPQPRVDQEPARRMERQRSQESLADSVRRFERSRGDRVLSAERMQSDGRDVNRIKAMDDRGRVRVYVDDPQRRGAQPPRGERPRRDDD
jgi:hypothetical protein